MNGRLQGHHTSGSLALESLNSEERIEGIAGVDRMQEFARLLEEGDERLANQMRKQTGARRCLDEDLETVCQ